MTGERIAKHLHSLKTKETAIPRLLFGRVISINPLTIRFNGNQMTIDATDFEIKLSPLVQDTEIGTSLIVNDNVIVERWNGGQLFYVKDRDE